MTLWERFYRVIGGAGPEDPCPVILPGYEDHHPPSVLADFLVRAGFLKRDPNLSFPEATYYVNYRWQWRFWRGPYRDCVLAEGLEPPSWWNPWKGYP